MNSEYLYHVETVPDGRTIASTFDLDCARAVVRLYPYGTVRIAWWWLA